MKLGDRVQMMVVHDDGEDKDYYYALVITRRPGAKLPKSQKPEEDQEGYARSSLLNDIENGEDVSAAEITKAFPPTFDKKSRAVVNPGGLSEKHRALLTANREKLEAEEAKKELKATPPDRK